MGVREVLDRKPDLVLSGVNVGANMADDVTYSGTIAGAMEGCLLGIPSIAFSQPSAHPHSPRWETATAHGAEVARRALAMGTVSYTHLAEKAAGGGTTGS